MVTGACFWYVFKQVDPIQTLSGIARLDVRWAAFAIFIAMLQIPLVALRWRNVLRALAACNERMTRAAMTAIRPSACSSRKYCRASRAKGSGHGCSFDSAALGAIRSPV